MGTISITTPSDGQTIDASDVATPLNTIVSEINGSLDSNNIASGGVVPNNLTAGTGTSWAWQSWTPTYSNVTVGNGTVVAKYIQIGKIVHFRYKLTFGSTTSFSGLPNISLPVTFSTEYDTAKDPINATVSLQDTGTALYLGAARFETSNLISIRTISTSGSFATYNASGVSATSPFTWTTGDIMTIEGSYEAA